VCAICVPQVPNKRLLHRFHLPKSYVTWVKSLMEMGLKDPDIIKRKAFPTGQHALLTTLKLCYLFVGLVPHCVHVSWDGVGVG